MDGDGDARLFTSKNERATVKVCAQIPATLLRLLFEDSDVGSSSEPWPFEDGLARTTYAPSISGTYLAVAHATRFMLLECQHDTCSKYRLVSVGEAPVSGETITSLLCMDIYLPQQQQQNLKQQQQQQASRSLCVVAGYSSGYLRIYSMYGHLMTTHRFHPQPLIRIRQRMPAHANSALTAGEMRYAAEDTEEVCLTYADGTLVSIDGRSLYLALRLCLSEALDGGAEEPVFQYKKWSFELNEPLVSDAVSYGPSAHRDPLAALAKSALTSSPLLSDATARFLVAPQHGDAAFGVFMTNEHAATSVSAVDIAGRVAARVTGAVLHMARSYFWRSSGAPSGGGLTDAGGVPASGEAGTTVPCTFAVRDSPRKVLDISLAPAVYGLAALTDSLGRILLFDLESCEAVQMLKGQRGSQCAWLESGNGPMDRRRMFVVVYTGRRGTVELFELGSPGQAFASVFIGPGWRLVQCPEQPLGGSLPVGPVGRAGRRAALPVPTKCILMSSKGEMASIDVSI
ncbi:hypothetical protein LPJ60_006308 [Coemansia sp. RSA 2675]|nr:hypothetical protein LPJ60_006308 [Coemansia sp. RSA 2675]